MEPTSYGRALLDCGTAVFDELRQGIKSIDFLANPTEGELRIAGNLPGFTGVIPATIDRFRRKYPQVPNRSQDHERGPTAAPGPPRADR